MGYDAVIEQVKSTPEEYLEEISNYISFIRYRSEKKNSEIDEFNSLCAESQKWAKSVGMTEADIQAAKKEWRAEKRRA